MAYVSDKYIKYGENKSPSYDSFDPLLVNLYDSLRCYRASQDKDSTLNTMTQAVIDILDANLTDTEKNLSADILIELIKQAERDIRASLAAKLAPREDIHPSLLHYLVYDEIDVARPVLIHSPSLSDMDLIYVIQSKEKEHWQSIAQRANISDTIVSTLVSKREDTTCANLLKNDSLTLDDDVLERIKPIACVSEFVAENFVNYKSLPRYLAVDIYWHVSVEIRKNITSMFKVDNVEIDKALEDNIQDFSDTLLQPNNIRPSRLMKEVADLYALQNRITDPLMVHTLRRRQGRFFIALFSKRTHLSVDVIWNMMRQIGGQGLAVACRAMNISKENFVSIFLLSRTMVRASQAVDANELKMAMRYYDGLTYKMANEILKDSIAN